MALELIILFMQSLLTFLIVERREGEREEKKKEKKHGRRFLIFVLKEFWNSNCHAEDNVFQYCVLKDQAH